MKRNRQRLYRPVGDGPDVVPDLVVKDNGSVAWIESADYSANPPPQVRKVDRLGNVVLDSGPDIDPLSLTLRGSTLRWKKGGVIQTATLD
jgi:hypothetical protein